MVWRQYALLTPIMKVDPFRINVDVEIVSLFVQMLNKMLRKKFTNVEKNDQMRTKLTPQRKFGSQNYEVPEFLSQMLNNVDHRTQPQKSVSIVRFS